MNTMPPINVAVFANGNDLAMLRLEDAEDHEAAAIVARGYSYCGSIGVNDGEVVVTCEDDPACAEMMPYAGVMFAGMLGPLVQQHQQAQQQEAGRDSTVIDWRK